MCNKNRYNVLNKYPLIGNLANLYSKIAVKLTYSKRLTPNL
jgi:hypothetical protein